MPWYLCVWSTARKSRELSEFLLPELLSNLCAASCTPRLWGQGGNSLAGSTNPAFPATWWIHMPDEKTAQEVAARGVLLRCIVEVWCAAPTMEEALAQVPCSSSEASRQDGEPIRLSEWGLHALTIQCGGVGGSDGATPQANPRLKGKYSTKG
mmetsp:Transcript_39320/g.111342  ORF Transcript_39320/g.111342 Transcript_39320/m.111342 type:complete len:153 (-) Transcript_39320:1681-2139(-)